jgi:hypothetical protein
MSDGLVGDEGTPDLADEYGMFYGVYAPAWADEKGLLGALRGMADSLTWDSDRNRALMLTAADRLEAARTELAATRALVRRMDECVRRGGPSNYAVFLPDDEKRVLGSVLSENRAAG